MELALDFATGSFDFASLRSRRRSGHRGIHIPPWPEIGAPGGRAPTNQIEAVAPRVIHWNFRRAKIPLSQCFQPAEQILLARDANDLIAQLAVLEKEQRRNRANVVLG